MDPELFAKCLSDNAAYLISGLKSSISIPRTEVEKIVDSFGNYLKQNAITSFFAHIIQRMKVLGENSDSLVVYESMMKEIQNSFLRFNTEGKFLRYLEYETATYIPPLDFKVGSKSNKDLQNNSVVNDNDDIMIQFIPLRRVLKKFLELPGMFQMIMEYKEELKNEKKVVSNIFQSPVWAKKEQSLGDKIGLPILLYGDEYGTNNPLGGHQKEGKVGALDIVLPFLPPEFQSKVENILQLALYKNADLTYVPLKNILAPVVRELNYLESNGIQIETPEGTFNVYFLLVKFIGDNMAANQIFGFTTGFSAKVPCRFCLTQSSEFKNVLCESDCELRTVLNYKRDLERKDEVKTGIVGESALKNIKTASMFDLMTVDVAHDYLEGVCQYDLGLVLNYFIKNKFFTLEQLNERILTFDYGDDEKRNRHVVKQSHIGDKCINMYASEMLCLIRNIGVLIGDFVPKGNVYWQIVISLKEILDILISPVVHDGIPIYLAHLIRRHLSMLVSLDEKHLVVKHHMLPHYPKCIEETGPIWNMNTLRGESKNQEEKLAVKNSCNRQNVCKSIAIKLQLRLSHRLINQKEIKRSLYEKKECKTKGLEHLPTYNAFLPFLPKEFSNDNSTELQLILFHNRTIKNGVILSFATETEPKMFCVVHLIENNTNNLCIIAKEITDYIMYDEHYQAYHLDDNYYNCNQNWICLQLDDLFLCTVTHVAKSSNSKKYILKRWI